MRLPQAQDRRYESHSEGDSLSVLSAGEFGRACGSGVLAGVGAGAVGCQEVI